jgi:uncharacterized protein (TIGR00730 family)
MARVKSVCVYCGSSNQAPRKHRQAAAELGVRLAEAGIEVVYGGGHIGLMGAVADGALAAGGKVTGIIPEHLLRREEGQRNVTRLIVTKSMHRRKALMFKRSDAFVILPGGPGTLDEFFEVLTWRQLHMHDKPIVLVGVDGYWRPLLKLIDWFVDHRYAARDFAKLFTAVSRIRDVIPALEGARPPRKRPRPKRL